MARVPYRLLRIGLVLLVVALPLRAARDIRPGFNLFSKSHDVQLGKESAQQLEKQLRVVDDPGLARYVAALGAQLAKTSQAPDYPYTFKVVAGQGINAFALPGGPVYVHAATLAAADNEAQLAGVLAHEISHVALRHGTSQVSKAYAWQIPLLLFGAMIGSDSLFGQLAQIGAGLGVNSILLKYSRDAERDADLVGVSTMARAGYDPVEMARFFQKLEAESGGRSLQFLSDHPSPGNRVQYVQDEVRTMPARRYSAGSPDFARIKALAAKAPVAPSHQFQEFRGDGYRLSHPASWRTYPGDSGRSVTIAPPHGLFQDRRGQAHVEAGAIAGYFSPRSSNLSAATDELVRDLAARNPGLRPRPGPRRPATLDGSPAEVRLLAGISPEGSEPEIDTLLAATRPQGLFYLVLIAPQSEYEALEGTFRQIQQSVRFR